MRYEITVTVDGVGSADDVGSDVVAALESEGIEAVVSHDTTSGLATVSMTLAAADLSAAAVAGISAIRLACTAAGLLGADVVSLTAEPARASSPAAA